MWNKREKIGEKLVYFIIALWFGSEILINTTIESFGKIKKNDFNNAMTVIVVALLIVQITFFQRYSSKDIIICFLSTLLIFYVAFTTGNNNLMSTWLFVIAAKYADIDIVALLSYLILLAMILCVFYLFFNGYISERVLYRAGVARHSWGFSHPNWLGVRAFQLVIAHFYVRRNKLMILDYMLGIVTTVFVYMVPNCQTACYAFVVFFAIIVFKKIIESFEGGWDIFLKMLIVSALVLNVFSVIFSIVDINNMWLVRYIDSHISNRLTLSHKVYEYYGIKLFGQDIQTYAFFMNHKIARFYLDSSYMSMLLRYGVFVYLFFSIVYIVAMWRAYKKERYMLLIILFMYSVYGIMENTFYSLSQNIFLFALADALYNNSLLEKTGNFNRSRIRYRIV